MNVRVCVCVCAVAGDQRQRVDETSIRQHDDDDDDVDDDNDWSSWVSSGQRRPDFTSVDRVVRSFADSAVYRHRQSVSTAAVSIVIVLRSTVMRVSACLFVCLSRITRKPHGRTSPNLFCMLPVAVARSSSAGVDIRYEHPVLMMTSCFHTMGQMGRIKHDITFRIVRQVEVPVGRQTTTVFVRMRHRGQSLLSTIALFTYVACDCVSVPVSRRYDMLRTSGLWMTSRPHNDRT